jgi:hypothetical protein
MTRKLAMTAAIVAIALTTPIGRGTAEAHNGGSGSIFHGGGFHGRDFRGGDFTTGAFMESGNFAVVDSGSVVSSVVTIPAILDTELAT